MATGIQINGTDIEDLLEKTRDNPDYSGGVVDITPTRPSPFANSGITQSNSSLTPLTHFFEAVLPENEAKLDMSNYIPSITTPLATKGYRPRINPYIRKLVFEVDGTSTIRYYVIKRRNNKLQIYNSVSLSGGFNLVKEIPSSSFPNNVVPSSLYVWICGGGGGGQGGALNDGDGGGGGAIALGYLTVTDSSGAEPSSDDYVIMVYRGGSGGSGRGLLVANGDYGEHGLGSAVFKNGATIFSTGGGRNGYSSIGGTPYIVDYTHTLLAVNGGSNGAGVSMGGTIFGESFSHSSSGGGGGGSIGYGGIDSSSGSGQSGYRGGGGGGGGNVTIFKKSGNGGNGGNGYFALYY